MTTTVKPAVSIGYKLELLKGLSHRTSPLFRIVTWLPSHDCNCEFCELPRTGEWVQLDDVDESLNDDVFHLDEAYEDLCYHLEVDLPEQCWRPVGDRQKEPS